ncbi:heavy-metal-associated domain-containing protein [Olsenella urininfantis]|uniref:heavy-metal-associated domain-containing protein n=1 Tax=Olsenella urininfantis TaxID=1871033 RepID=UPI000986D6A9|nr:heavy metal-associated domain-containing protein [Olsenella urininfantis]
MLANVIILSIVALLLAVGVRRAVGTATGRRDCCSGDAMPRGKGFRPVRIADADESHYPYQASLLISGMSCERCARNVANALNSLEGHWARVDLDGRVAHVLSKEPIDLDACTEKVLEAGYRVIGTS